MPKASKVTYASMLFLIVISVLPIWQSPEAVSLQSDMLMNRKEIKDGLHDWIDLASGNNTIGINATDIQSVSYSSDGRFLNVTYWLTALDAQPHSNTTYGLLIDSDLNNATGFQGTDFQAEIIWNNMTGQWTKRLIEFSSNGKYSTIQPECNTTVGILNQANDYIKLDVNLTQIFSPQNYKVFFYAYSYEEQQDKDNAVYAMDNIKWVSIPAPAYVITTVPDSVTIRPGESTSVEVRLNTTVEIVGSPGYVHFYYTDIPEGIDMKFEHPSRIVSPLGITTTHLTIHAKNDAESRPYTTFILANVTFPVEYFNSPVQIGEDNKKGRFYIEGQNASMGSPFTLTVDKPLGIQEWLFGSSRSSVRLTIPQEYIVGLYGIALSFLVPSAARWYSGRRQRKYVSKYMTMIIDAYNEKSSSNLEDIKNDVAKIYSMQKINEIHYKILNDKIAEYQSKLVSHS